MDVKELNKTFQTTDLESKRKAIVAVTTKLAEAFIKDSGDSSDSEYVLADAMIPLQAEAPPSEDSSDEEVTRHRKKDARVKAQRKKDKKLALKIRNKFIAEADEESDNGGLVRN